MNRDDCYRHLAADVLARAVQDVKNAGRSAERRAARYWLLHESCKEDRSLWLAWLDMDDDTFQKIIRMPKWHDGEENKLIGLLKGKK